MNDKKKEQEERKERLSGNKETLAKYVKRLETTELKHSENRRDLLVKAMLRKVSDANDDLVSSLRGLDLILGGEAEEIKKFALAHQKTFIALQDALKQKVKK